MLQLVRLLIFLLLTFLRILFQYLLPIFFHCHASKSSNHWNSVMQRRPRRTTYSNLASLANHRQWQLLELSQSLTKPPLRLSLSLSGSFCYHAIKIHSISSTLQTPVSKSQIFSSLAQTRATKLSKCTFATNIKSSKEGM